MAVDRPSITIADRRAIVANEGKREALPDDLVADYATGALGTLRGLSRSDKLRVIRRMQRMLGSQAGARTPRRKAGE